MGNTNEGASGLARRIGDQHLTSVRQLVDGNHVRADEIQESLFRHCDCAITIDVTWQFVARYSEQTIAGDASVSGAHYGNNRNNFLAEFNLRKHQASHNLELRRSFQENILSSNTSLSWSHEEKLAWDFGQHSYCHTCGKCHGHGDVNCGSCHGSGKTTCYHCHGSGWTWQTRTRTSGSGQVIYDRYQQECNVCFCACKLNCNQCGATGKQRCNSCSGHGFFTDIIHTKAVAIPSISYRVNASFLAQELADYMSEMGNNYAAQYFDFSLHQNYNNNHGSWVAQYVCPTTLVEQHFSLRQKKYLAAAVGSRVVPFVRPHLFDDIFKEELHDLHAIYGKSKEAGINKDQALHFFKTYCGQPVLDRALQSVAKLSASDRKTPGGSVSNACKGYISQSAASDLGKCMADLLDRVSPAYSKWSWILIMLLPLVYVALSIENAAEFSRGGSWESTATIFGTFIAGMVLLLFVSPFAWLFSAIHSAYERQSVPAPYRQRPRNWEPFSKVIGLYFLATIFLVPYGLGARFDVVPRWEGKIKINIERQIAKQAYNLIESSPWLKSQIPYYYRMALVASNPSLSNTPMLNDIGECKKAWHTFSQLPAGEKKEKLRKFFEIEYGTPNFHANCVGSALKRKCDALTEIERLPQGFAKDRLRSLLEKENFKPPYFDKSMCRLLK